MAFEDGKGEGDGRSRGPYGVVGAASSRSRETSTGPDDATESPMARVAELWSRIDTKGADAWHAYAQALSRRAGSREARLSGYSAFVRVASATLAEKPFAELSLVPPTLRERRPPRRKRRGGWNEPLTLQEFPPTPVSGRPGSILSLVGEEPGVAPTAALSPQVEPFCEDVPVRMAA